MPMYFSVSEVKDRVVMEDEFNDVSNMVIVGTDDGSYGYNGYIASAMEQYLDSHKCDMILFMRSYAYA